MLVQIIGKNNALPNRPALERAPPRQASFGGFEEKFRVGLRIGDPRLGPGLAVPATGMAGLGAFPQGLVNDGLDGARAPAAFDVAAEAVIDLLGAARQIHRGAADRMANIVVAEDVAGTNNHESGEACW